MSRWMCGVSRIALLSSLAALAAPLPVLAASFNVPPDSGAQTVVNDDTGNVAAGNTLTAATAITWNGGSLNPGVIITNFGTITGTTRGIDTGGGFAAGSITVNNNFGATLSGTGNDAFRINTGIGGGTVTLNNAGLVLSQGGQALDWAANSSAGSTTVINNAGTGVIRSTASDAIRIGVGTVTIDNSGLIESTSGDRAINVESNINNLASFRVFNRAGATIQSEDDVIRINGSSGNATTTGTFLVDNAGTIRATDGGQAIDFDNISSPNATITIINRATGVMTANNADAVRPGANGAVTNYGLIMSTDVIGSGEGSDGIDFQDRSGTVNNMAGGTISGFRHGITVGAGTLMVTNQAGGIIIGRNGSGIGSDNLGTNAATIVNAGRITGAYAGVNDGDGDGVDIDGQAIIRNYGIIEGTGADGVNNFSEGIAAGGGTIVNAAGALISGAHNGILIDDSNVGDAPYAVNINNAGTIQGLHGFGIRIISNLANTITNSGAIIGTNGSGILFGSGDDTLNVMPGSKIVGLTDGAAGSDTLNYNKVGLTEAKRQALIAGQTVSIGGSLYTGFENVSAATGSFSSFAANSTTQGIAGLIDAIGGQVSLGIQTLIDRVASASDVNGALAQLTPTAFQSFTTFGIDTSFQTAQLLGQRLDNARGGVSSFDVSGLEAISPLLESDRSRRALVPGALQPDDGPFGALGYAPAQTSLASSAAFAAMNHAQTGGYLKAPGLAAQADNPGGVFMYGHATFGRTGATANSPETRFTTVGLTVGIDRHVTPDLVAGVFGGFSRTTADLDTVGSTGNISTLLAGVYGSYYRHNMFANAAFIYGHNSYDNTRMAIGTANTSSPDGHQFAVQGSVGADFRYGLWIVTPEIGVQYTTVRVDGFTETGLAALTVEADKADSLRSSLGVRMRYEWLTAWGLFIPEWRASWQHEFLDQERDIRASFVDTSLPGTFATTAAGDGRDFGVVGAGIGKALSGSTLMSLNYDFKFGGHSLEAHQVSGRLRHTF